MSQKDIDNIIKEISLRYCIPKIVIKEIVESQFKFVRKVVEEAEKNKEDTFKNVNIPHFGKFACKPNRLKYFKKSNNGEDEST